MAGVATGVRGIGMHPSNIAGGVAAVNSTMAIAATARLGGLTNNNRHLNYSTVNHHHNQTHNPQVLSGLGTGIVAYGHRPHPLMYHQATHTATTVYPGTYFVVE